MAGYLDYYLQSQLIYFEVIGNQHLHIYFCVWQMGWLWATGLYNLPARSLPLYGESDLHFKFVVRIFCFASADLICFIFPEMALDEPYSDEWRKCFNSAIYPAKK